MTRTSVRTVVTALSSLLASGASLAVSRAADPPTPECAVLGQVLAGSADGFAAIRGPSRSNDPKQPQWGSKVQWPHGATWIQGGADGAASTWMVQWLMPDAKAALAALARLDQDLAACPSLAGWARGSVPNVAATFRGAPKPGASAMQIVVTPQGGMLTILVSEAR